MILLVKNNFGEMEQNLNRADSGETGALIKMITLHMVNDTSTSRVP